MSDNFKVVKEKVEYLITSALQENNFNVFDIDIYIDTHTPKTTGVEEPKTLVERYDINIDFDYNGALDSYDPYSFSRDIVKMCEILKESVSQFTITQEGKIVRGDENIDVSEPIIMSIDFKHEELHKFIVNFIFNYYE
jgi:hypothetical protein